MKKPIIGVSVNYSEAKSMVAEEYYRCVELAGGVPLLLPMTTCRATISRMLDGVDGVLLTGGGDMSPEYYGQKPIAEVGEPCHSRDLYDWLLMQEARSRQLPILGICRGMQTINIAFGGDLYQDIKVCYKPDMLEHSQSEERKQATHDVEIAKGSLLGEILKKDTLRVNSIHHQSVANVGDGLRASALAPDGVVEAVESLHYDTLGVQWHPEHLAFREKCENEVELSEHMELFRWLVGEAELFAKAKAIHQKHLVVDSHTDTPMFFHYPEVNIVRNERLWVDPSEFDDAGDPVFYEVKVDAEKMRQGGVSVAFVVAYIPQRTPKEQAYTKAVELLEKVKHQAEQNPEHIRIAADLKDLAEAKEQGVPTLFLGVENGWAIGDDLENIDRFYQMGVRYITLCHNGDNQICDSASASKQTHGGLSEFGRRVVERMNRLGMMIDLSHAGEQTFWNVIEALEKPVVATHSSCRALCDHPRNLTDEQIRALAAKGGVVQICLYKHFLRKDGQASVKDAVKHIKHVVELVGADYVGVGSDFDGGGEVLGCRSENELINITKELLREGFQSSDIAKIMGGNFLRVLGEISGL